MSKDIKEVRSQLGSCLVKHSGPGRCCQVGVFLEQQEGVAAKYHGECAVRPDAVGPGKPMRTPTFTG